MMTRLLILGMPLLTLASCSDPNPWTMARLESLRLSMLNDIERDITYWSDNGHRERLIQLPFQQACFLYRTSRNHDLKGELLCRIMEWDGEKVRIHGTSAAELLALLGRPDDIWGSGTQERMTFVYTGEGRVSDGMSGYVFDFDPSGRLEKITPAN